MAEVRAKRGCGSTCGCPIPCPGGDACRFQSRLSPHVRFPVEALRSSLLRRLKLIVFDNLRRCAAGADVTGGQHALCSCGEHCGCNPCQCGRSTASPAVGRADCACGSGCRCSACAA
ncbi:uncharacterized protein LOC144714825 [Wolffia australiana]